MNGRRNWLAFLPTTVLAAQATAARRSCHRGEIVHRIEGDCVLRQPDRFVGERWTRVPGLVARERVIMVAQRIEAPAGKQLNVAGKMNAVLHDCGRLMIVFPQPARTGSLRTRRWLATGKRRDGLIDILRADLGVNRAVLNDAVGGGRIGERVVPRLLHAAQKARPPTARSCVIAPGLHMAGHDRLSLRVDAQFAGIAIVVDVICRRRERRSSWEAAVGMTLLRKQP